MVVVVVVVVVVEWPCWGRDGVLIGGGVVFVAVCVVFFGMVSVL